MIGTKMESRLPNKEEINELVQFLPRLYAKGFTPIKRWNGGKDEDGVSYFPWPEYEQEVNNFISAASEEIWLDRQYIPNEGSKMLQSEQKITEASLQEIKSMLTFCLRGERFCDGHVASVIEAGKIKSILKRLKVIMEENEF